MKFHRALLIGLLCLFPAARSGAFPEMVRDGYANCILCHYNPGGSGILTPYGRALSVEVLSNSGGENEAKFLYGAVTPPKWLDLGGDFRGLQAYFAQNGAGSARTILMQADVEAAANVGKLSFVASGGIDFNASPISRRHYAIYHATDSLTFRAGKFMPIYGINSEDHALAIKRGIGKDQSGETYNAEVGYITKDYDVFVSAIAGRPDTPSLGAEAGGSLSASVFAFNSAKIGASYYHGERTAGSRNIMGPFFILGLSPRIYALVETDFIFFTPAIAGLRSTTGAVDDIRLDFEVIKGLHFYLLQELSQLDISNGATFQDSYGLGVQFFPRPHLELNAVYQKQRFGGTSASFGDFAWLMLHFYL